MLSIDSSYDGIDWTTTGQYTVASHIQTNYGTDHGHNGEESPQDVIGFYASEGVFQST